MASSDIDDVLLTADQWVAKGRQVALVTIIEAWDQAPHPAGSLLAVDGDGDGETIGSISEGLIEEPVLAEALKTIGDQEPRLLSFQISDEMAAEKGCETGGDIRLFVEPIEVEG
ncbi:MAG: XdhC family protein [Alphaproteobacteria bacterium]|nr:XdhC family protein [Alphaproteobacteria bacterium SS10]